MPASAHVHLMSHPSSPQSSALPSPPSSPGSSFSSLPSSAFSLSVPSSPPRADSPFSLATHSLVLPSLTLEPSECVPNLSGETLGLVNLIIIGAKASGKTYLAESLVHGNPDVLDVGEWADDPSLGKVLSAETRTESEAGAFGNIKLVEVPGFDQTDDPQGVAKPVLDAIHFHFRAVLPLLSPTHPPDSALRDLLASPQSQFFTAAILLTSSPPTSLENTLLSMLSPHIPVIPIASPSLPHTSRPSSRIRSRAPRGAASSARPLTLNHLRTTLFRRPVTLRKLRCDAAERFLWWREVEAATQQPDTLRTLLSTWDRGEQSGFEQEKWDWELQLSRDVAVANAAAEESRAPPPEPGCIPSSYLPLDPLHLHSLLLLSLSIFRPLRNSVAVGIKFGVGMRWLALTMVGAFCAGASATWLLGGS